jgi:hypothetical protein
MGPAVSPSVIRSDALYRNWNLEPSALLPLQYGFPAPVKPVVPVPLLILSGLFMILVAVRVVELPLQIVVCDAVTLVITGEGLTVCVTEAVITQPSVIS